MPVPNILIIGAGTVGAASAAVMARKQLGSVFLYDITENLAIGRAMDINQASPYLYTDTRVTGCNSIEEVPDVEVVVITAGHARHAGMTRLDLLKKNIDVINALGEKISVSFRRAKVVVVTNPVDIIAWYMKKKWPEMNVFGIGCSLDTMRFRFFIAEAFGGSVDCARGIVIGTHNDSMIPLVNHATVGGVPLKHILDEPTIYKIVHRTRTAGTAVTQRLKQHSGSYAAGHVVTQITESIVFNRLGTFPLSVTCNGEYGYNNIPLALPSVVGHEGITRILDMELDDEERKGLNICAEQMADIVKDL